MLLLRLVLDLDPTATQQCNDSFLQASAALVSHLELLVYSNVLSMVISYNNIHKLG